MSPCRAWLLTYHPLAACGAKTRVRARIVAAGSTLQRRLFSLLRLSRAALHPTVGRAAFELYMQ